MGWQLSINVALDLLDYRGAWDRKERRNHTAFYLGQSSISSEHSTWTTGHDHDSKVPLTLPEEFFLASNLAIWPRRSECTDSPGFRTRTPLRLLKCTIELAQGEVVGGGGEKRQNDIGR